MKHLGRLRWTLVAGGLAAAWTAAAAGACDLSSRIQKTVVFESGTEGYPVYRIPTLVKAANGDLLAFAEARESTSDSGEIDIVMKRSRDDGRTWGTLQVVKDSADFEHFFPPDDRPRITVGNQSPVVDRLDPDHAGRIWMLFTLENDRVFATSSDDHGQTWSAHVEITAAVKRPEWGWYATGPVHGIQLTRGEHAGRLIIPSDHGIAQPRSWGAHVVYSDDHGQTWQLGAVDTRPRGAPVHPNENVAVELVEGRVYFNARDQHGSSEATRATAYSSDGGLSYDAPFAPEPQITTPVVQNSVLRFRAVDEGDDHNVLVHCGPGDANRRRDLTIRASFDEGATWTQATLIHPGPAAYCDLVKLDGHRVGVLYEAGERLYEQIVFGWLEFDELLGGEME